MAPKSLQLRAYRKGVEGLASYFLSSHSLLGVPLTLSTLRAMSKVSIWPCECKARVRAHVVNNGDHTTEFRDCVLDAIMTVYVIFWVVFHGGIADKAVSVNCDIGKIILERQDEVRVCTVR
jgi:hypothetical protein